MTVNPLAAVHLRSMSVQNKTCFMVGVFGAHVIFATLAYEHADSLEGLGKTSDVRASLETLLALFLH